MTWKVLIILTIAAIVAKPLLGRRWPEIAHKINIALIAALIAVIIFRILMEFRPS